MIDPSTTSILIVDDTPNNLRLLAGILAEHGYIVRPTISGSRALTAIQAELPDLVLLDIKMPDMDGYAVCKQLKADERTHDIPVIFISALDDVQDKVKGFALGGVDYITKPFQAQEVLARVRMHLTLRSLQIRLEDQNSQLQQEISSRRQAEEELQTVNQQLKKTNQELVETNASKDTFFSIIAHDLKAPFTGLIGLTEALVEDIEYYNQDKLTHILQQLHLSAKQTYTLLTNLLTWSRLERGLIDCKPEDVLLANVVDPVVFVLASNAQQKQVTVTNSVETEISVYADFRMIDTVLRNLLSNALKFTEMGGEIGVSAESYDDYVEIAVTDTGIGMSQEKIDILFRIDKKTSTPGTAGEEGTGLGLILCKELVEKNGGTIWVKSAVGKGTTVFFTLPTNSQTHKLINS